MDSSCSLGRALARIARSLILVGVVLALGAGPASAATNQLVFQGYNDDEGGLFKVDSDGTDVLNITSQNGRDPSLSPDGLLVAFVDSPAGSNEALWVVSASGGEPEKIYEAPSGTTLTTPRFDPDGETLVYSEQFFDSQTFLMEADIYRIGVDGSNRTRVIDWPGQQLEPSLSSDGTKMTFWSTKTPSGAWEDAARVYVTSATGGSPLAITAPSVVDATLGHPRFSPNGEQVAFNATPPDEWDWVNSEIYKVDVDGTDQVQITDNDYADWKPDWSPLGNRISFTSERPPSYDYQTYTITPDGTNEAILMSGSGFGYFQEASYRQPSAEREHWHGLAERFRPSLRFDTSETYRPVEVERFFAETNDQGEPLHDICLTSCSPITSAADLIQDDEAYIDVAGDGNADNYHSPYAECTDEGLRDCDWGERSSIYYYKSDDPSSPSSYYLDYWIFYRYNDWNVTVGGDHAGDWESVTLAANGTNPATFDFASFSGHGGWFSYLRNNLSCDGQGVGSCGSATSPTGQRVDVYVASGSHANYGQPCSASVVGSCTRNSNPLLPEAGHDGSELWANNSNVVALNPLPDPTSGFPSWTSFAGQWGAPSENGPSGPAHGDNGDHFYGPDAIDGCAPNNSCAASRSPRARLAQKVRRNDRCGTWFGSGVVAAACTPSRLRAAVAQRRLRGDGGFQLSRTGGAGTTGSAPGIAQAMGVPLRPGERMALTGQVPDGTDLLVRASARGEVVRARFENLSAQASGRSVAFVEVNSGRPTVRLRLGNGRVLKPTRLVPELVRRGLVEVHQARATGSHLRLAYTTPTQTLLVDASASRRGRTLMPLRTIRTRANRKRALGLDLPMGARYVRLVGVRADGSRTAVRIMPLAEAEGN